VQDQDFHDARELSIVSPGSVSAEHETSHTGY
jgi:hypothetical protein